MPVAEALHVPQRSDQVTLGGLFSDSDESVGRAAEGRDHDYWLPVHPRAHDHGGALDRRRIAERGAAKFDDDHASASRPVAASSSAFNTDPPAAPRIVLCPTATILRCSTLSSRMRPTVTVLPAPALTSRRGCGRSLSAATWSGRSGRLGRPRVSSAPAHSDNVAIASSAEGRSRNEAAMHMVCPCSTGTRFVCALTRIAAGTTSPFAYRPRSLHISRSTFGSSSAMKGMTLPIMSSDATPGYPAPDTACSAVTISVSTTNFWWSGARASAAIVAAQFALVTMALCLLRRPRRPSLRLLPEAKSTRTPAAS